MSLTYEQVRSWGKADFFEHVRSELSAQEMPICDYHVIEPGKTFFLVPRAFKRHMRAGGKVRARSSYSGGENSPGEFDGFEGIFWSSERGVNSGYHLEDHINRVRESFGSDRAELYAAQKGFEIDGTRRVLLQHQAPTHYTGAMMRHPNNPDLIFISYSEGHSKTKLYHHHFIFDERIQGEGNSKAFVYGGSGGASSIPLGGARFLVDKYKAIEGVLGDVAREFSVFVEFGYNESDNDFRLHQGRLFRKIETADFELPNVEVDRENVIKTDLVMGVTPDSDGIVLPTVRGFSENDIVRYLRAGRPIDGTMGIYFDGYEQAFESDLDDARFVGDGDGFHNYVLQKRKDGRKIPLADALRDWNLFLDDLVANQCDEGHAFLMPHVKDERYDVDLSVPHMSGLVVGDIEKFLVHDFVRLLRNADVTIGLNFLSQTDLYRRTSSGLYTVRLISNGREGLVIRE